MNEKYQTCSSEVECRVLFELKFTGTILPAGLCFKSTAQEREKAPIYFFSLSSGLSAMPSTQENFLLGLCLF